MTYLTLINPPDRSTDIANAMVLTVADTLDQAYADIIDYRDGGGVHSVLWQALILDDLMTPISRLMAGEVTSLESITAAELISEGDDLPQDDEGTDPVDNSVDDPVDNSEEEENPGVTVEETEEQP